jgi:hypothetical protein
MGECRTMTLNELMSIKLKENDLQNVHIYYYWSENYRCTVDIETYFGSDAQFLYGNDEIIETIITSYNELNVFID